MTEVIVTEPVTPSISLNVTPLGSSTPQVRIDGEALENVGPTHGLPPGGTTGQVIVKNSSADYDTRWANTVRVHVGPTPPEDTSMVWIDTNA